MAQDHKTSPVEAFRVATASIIFAITAQIILGLGFFVGLVAYRRGSLHEDDLWLVLTVSCFPYAVLTLQTIWRVIGGMDSIFPQPQKPPTTVKNYVVQGIDTTPVIEHHLVPVFNTPAPRINGVPILDFIEFIDLIPQKGIKSRNWRGSKRLGIPPHRFKSRRICRYHTWKAIVDTLAAVNVIIDMQPGKSGELAVTHPPFIKQILRVQRIVPEEYL